MGTRCPGCNGKRGRVYAWIVVERIASKADADGAKKVYVYWRMTHKRETEKGVKRVYCYVRVENVKLEDLPVDKVPDFEKLKAGGSRTIQSKGRPTSADQ